MLLVYGQETRGHVAPEGGVSISRNIPISQLLGGSASFPGNAAAKRAFSRVLLLSLPCFVSVRQWRRLLPAFSASPGLCWRSFLCLTEHWTELESENEPPRKRKRLSLRSKKAIRARPANWRRRTAGRCTKRLAFFPLL